MVRATCWRRFTHLLGSASIFRLKCCNWRSSNIHSYILFRPMPVLYQGEFVGEGSGSDKSDKKAGTNKKD